MADLQIRAPYRLNVMGLMEEHTFDDHVHHHLALNPSVNRPLTPGDVLLLLGEDIVLDQFQLNMSTPPHGSDVLNGAEDSENR